MRARMLFSIIAYGVGISRKKTLSVSRNLRTQKMPPESFFAALRGHPYIRYALAHTAGIYSISIRFGFSGRAFVC